MFAEESIWVAAEPVSPAAWLTDEILVFTSSEALESYWILLDISCVAAPCSSTAAAIVDAISSTVLIVLLIEAIALTASPVALWIAATWLPISSVAFAV